VVAWGYAWALRVLISADADMSVQAMLEEIDGFVCDEQMTVTYQWLSRKLSVPAEISKR
jgi:hypothetical protein